VNLADIWPSRLYFAGSALLAGLANAALLVAPGFGTALLLRFLTGFFLAGVYPPAMKMAATWFRSARGFAVGTVVGALTVGKATPYLLKVVGGPGLAPVVLGASAGALIAALLVALGYRDGPFRFKRSPFSWERVGRVVRHRETLLATGGYLGHMWELYAVWTWVPAWVVAGATARSGQADPGAADLVGFGAIAAGGLGCVWAGRAADRWGRERVASWALVASGGCCLAAGLVFGAPLPLVALFTAFWGFFVVADSAQFSALVTEVAPSDSVGTALTLQTSAGFLLTMVTIQGVPAVVERVGWAWAFVPLAVGPLLGILAMRRLARVRSAG
jgi:MFS family permease